MTQQRAQHIAWSVWVVSVAAILTASVLASLYPFTSAQEVHDPAGETVWALSWVGFGLVGAMIVSRRPTQRIGWLLVAITAGLAVTMFVPSYARAAFEHAGALPFGSVAAWIAAWAFYPSTGLVLALLLMYPDGYAGGRSGLLLKLLVPTVALRTLIGAFTPGPIEGDAPPFNPLGLGALESQLHAAADGTSFVIVAIAMLILADFVYRFWRSHGTQRMQFRWLALAAVAFPVLFLAGIWFEQTFLTADTFDPVVTVFFVCGNGLAAAIWVAISRHGLYEIDRVISRTVGYLLLTASLVVVYLAAVTVLTAATAPITKKSPIAVAAATLLAAAAFGPARRRIQDLVDRRFNRARYDAAVTVDAYRGRLRDEVDLETVSADLVATVLSVMQPAGTQLWLAGAVGAQKISVGGTAVTVPERPHETKGTS